MNTTAAKRRTPASKKAEKKYDATKDPVVKAYASFVKNNFYFRAGAGRYGTGLFAVRDIPRGTRMVAGHPPGTHIPSAGKKEYAAMAKKGVYTTAADYKKLGLTDRQIALMKDFACRGDNREYVPIIQPYDMLFPPLYQYSNHSDRPNVKVEGYHLVALRKIKNGEELYHDYRETCGPDELIF